MSNTIDKQKLVEWLSPNFLNRGSEHEEGYYEAFCDVMNKIQSGAFDTSDHLREALEWYANVEQYGSIRIQPPIPDIPILHDCGERARQFLSSTNTGVTECRHCGFTQGHDNRCVTLLEEETEPSVDRVREEPLLSDERLQSFIRKYTDFGSLHWMDAQELVVEIKRLRGLVGRAGGNEG